MQYLCLDCHHIGKPKSDETPLLLLLAIPLLALDSGEEVIICPKCDRENSMISIDTEDAQKIISKYNLEVPDDPDEGKLPWQA